MDILDKVLSKSNEIDVDLWAADNDNAVVSQETGCKSVAGHKSTKHVLETCPFCGTEDRAAVFIGEYPSFKRGFHCYHNSCADKTFKDLAEKWELNYHKHHKDVGENELVDLDRVEQGLPTLQQVKDYKEAKYGSGFEFEALSMGEFREEEYDFEWLIDGKFIQGQNLVVAGGSKSLKTTISLDAAISLATGTPWLGEFNVAKPRKVLFIAGEGGGAELQRRVLLIEKEKGVNIPDDHFFFSTTLPCVSNHEHLEMVKDFVDEKGIEVIFVDPAYLAFLGAKSESSSSNVFDMGAILHGLNAKFKDSGATIAIVHHYKKNSALPANGVNKFVPPTLADISQSGFAEFARSWWLLGRTRPFKDGVHSLYLETGGQACGTDTYHVAVDEGVKDLDMSGGKWGLGVTTWGAHSENQENELKKLEQEKLLEEIRKAKDVVYRFLINQPLSSTSAVNAATSLSKKVISEAVQLLLEEDLVIENNDKPYSRYEAITSA